MDNTIDLSSPQCPEVLQFHGSHLKWTATGKAFYSWNGLRLYLITGKQHPKYLDGIGLEEAGVENKYEFVESLYQQLEDALRINIAKFPLLRLKLNKRTRIIWTAYGITPAEEEWVKIVQRVVASM
ncbi:hypothetical protein AVT69_gp199 [Pseudomonas phage PhiPA3]|uniref:Uncharacterized protein 201 n=1 Tax=Pseudomonas phage PhiPA3 TaxID=998086 RepID=F8SJ44_BPPA3|nr:hypothetical protein AVT69_gp199 [Pseudomonas phage PhiPA3]AEH03624.1 hypothetical protein [Pseudomonas phage PhiPA3]